MLARFNVCEIGMKKLPRKNGHNWYLRGRARINKLARIRTMSVAGVTKVSPPPPNLMKFLFNIR
jgi:hypothetical protein